MELYGYQKQDIAQMVRERKVLNASACGLGKTTEAVELARFLGLRLRIERVLVVAPRPTEWIRMIGEQAPQARVMHYCGSPEKRKELRATFQLERPFFVITTFGLLLRKEDQSFFAEITDDKTLLLVDEAHQAKGFSARRRNVLKGLANKARNVVAMTATPIWNRPDDLFYIMEWLNPKILGSKASFFQKYLVVNRFGQVTGLKAGVLPDLKKRLSRFVISRSAADAEVSKELPDLRMSRHYCELKPAQSRKISDVAADVLHALEELSDQGEFSWNRFPSGKALARLCELDMASIYMPGIPSAKLDTLKDTLPGLISGSNVVVFCHYLDILHGPLLDLASSITNTYIYSGRVSNKVRDKALKDFRDDSSAILLLSDAGREAINIPEAQYAIHLDLPWGWSELDQRSRRICRIDSAFQAVWNILLVTRGIDDYKWALIDWKRSMQASIIDDSEHTAGKPSLRKILEDLVYV